MKTFNPSAFQSHCQDTNGHSIKTISCVTTGNLLTKISNMSLGLHPTGRVRYVINSLAHVLRPYPFINNPLCDNSWQPEQRTR
jgi:hypothetical protein